LLINIELKDIQKEKYDHANTAFLMYESVLRNTDKLIDEFQPDDRNVRSTYQNKLTDQIYGLDNIILSEADEKPVKPSRNRSKNKKKVPASQKTDIKMEPLYPEPKVEFNPDVQMPQEENVTCPCNQNNNDDWVGCDMHDKCKYEWFHLQCVGLPQPPLEDELWFCDYCKKDFKKEIEQKIKENNAKKNS
jgi:hypothetical protein